jgi:hypothetical protein
VKAARRQIGTGFITPKQLYDKVEPKRHFPEDKDKAIRRSNDIRIFNKMLKTNSDDIRKANLLSSGPLESRMVA